MFPRVSLAPARSGRTSLESQRRKALLQDLAIVTGGDYIASDLGMTVEEVQLDNLGCVGARTQALW